MRLRELKLPIAVLKPRSLIGGKSAGLSRRGRFDLNLADYYKRGAYDDALVYDAEGNEYEVEKIELHPISLVSRIGIWLGLPIEWLASILYRLFGKTYSGPEFADVAWIDMVLKRRRQLSLDEFQQELRDVALSHPDWWRRHSERAQIESMFNECRTFAEAIHRIGVLDPPGKERLPGKSNKVIDLR